jgi:RNA polymerase sigma factor (sigma-70 family)
MRQAAPRPSTSSPPETLGEAALVARCREGDEAAWEALVQRLSRYVYAIVGAFRLSEAEAEDCFQEVFARTYEQLGSLRSDEAIRPWIAQLTRRLAIDQLRASARAAPSLGVDERPAAGEDLFARLDDALAVRAALAELPDHCREILDRFFAQDQSYRAISDALDLPAGTIASRISRCLTKLRATLEGRKSPPPTS